MTDSNRSRDRIEASGSGGWIFAPLITLRGATTLERSIKSRIIASLGIFWRQGSRDSPRWRLWKYVGEPSTRPIDQYYDWWETGNEEPTFVALERSGFASGLEEFGAVLLPNFSAEKKPVHLSAQADLWHHVFIPCGECSVSSDPGGEFTIHFGLRSACGLPAEIDNYDVAYEVPVTVMTGTGSKGEPIISIGSPLKPNEKLQLSWNKIEDGASATFKRQSLTGGVELFDGRMVFQHSAEGDKDFTYFWWAKPDGAPDSDRGRNYVTYLRRHTISWAKIAFGGRLEVAQLPSGKKDGQRVIDEGAIVHGPVPWTIRTRFNRGPISGANAPQDTAASLTKLWASWSSALLNAVKSGVANDGLSFVPELPAIRTAGQHDFSEFSCEDTKGSEEAALQFDIATAQSDGTYFTSDARFSAVQGETTKPGEWGILTATLKFRLLPREIGGRPDAEIFLFDRLTVLDNALCFRDNAFQWQLGTEPVISDQTDLGRIRLGWRQQKVGGGQPNDLDNRIFVEISGLEFGITQIRPVAQDATPEVAVSSLTDYEARDYRADPLVIPIDSATLSAKAVNGQQKYRLAVVERCHPGRARNLALEIKVNEGVTPSLGTRVIVLDPHPFTVAAMPLSDFSFLDDAESGRVLARRIYDEETGVPVWRLVVNSADPNRALLVVFPPQAVGEEALLRKKVGKTLFYDVRLGALALIGLESSYFNQRYGPVPWDLRWILGRPQERDTGAGIRWLEFELLYGLIARFVPGTSSPKIRLAEAASRLGSWPGGLPETLPWAGNKAQRNAFNSLRHLFGVLVRRYVGRLGLYQLKAADDATDVILGDDLTIRPRVAPGKEVNDLPVGAYLHWLPDPENPDSPLPFSADPISTVIDRLHSKPADEDTNPGLPGGFEWGMQEWGEAWIRAFWTTAIWPTGRSSSAQISGLGFSALGGWGHQIARFMKDRILIEAQVAQGRANVYTVERIGRIAAFWNKAKHVIRYERSSVPAPEFAEDQVDDSGWPILGRPILRKVDEYIEILQDRREFPDKPPGQPIHTGPIHACVFPKVGYRIRIRGSWGRSLDKAGNATGRWEVPLWQPGANPERFPKPEIHLELLTRRAGDNARSADTSEPASPTLSGDYVKFFQAIAHPEDVYFYTDGDPQLSGDPGEWEPVREVDFTDQLEPLESDWIMPTEINPDVNQFPDALDVAPGMKRFSFRLEAAQDETVVTACRQEINQIRGRARAVTMMRSSPAYDDPGAGQRKGIRPNPTTDGLNADLAANVTSAYAAERDMAITRGKMAFGLPSTVARLSRGDKPSAADVAAEIQGLFSGKFQTIAGSSQPPLCPPPTSGDKNPILRQVLVKAALELENRAETFINVRLETAVRAVDEGIAHAASGIEGIKQAAIESLDTQIHFLRSAEPHFSVGFESLTRFFCEQIDHVADEARTQCDTIFSVVQKFLDAAEAELEHFAENEQESLTRLDSLKAQVTRGASVLTTSLDELKAKLDTSDPNAPFGAARIRIAKAIGELRDDANNLSAALTAAVQKAHDDIQAAGAVSIGLAASVLSNLRQATTAARNDLITRIEQAVKTIQEQSVAGVGQSVTTAIAQLEANIADLINNGIDLLDAAKKTILNVPGQVDLETRKAIDDLKKAVNQFETALPSKVQPCLNATVCPFIDAICSIDLGLGAYLDETFWDAINQTADIKNSIDRLQQAIKDGNVDEAISEAEALGNRINKRFGFYSEQALALVKDVYDSARDVKADAVQVVQDAKDILRSVRAVADALTAPGLGFNRRTIALLYGTQEAIHQIATTPIIGRLKQLNDHLKPLGLNLPIGGLADRFLPHGSLPNFDFNRLLRDLGGANLTGLFKGLKMPRDLGDALKVTHGVEKESMRAWVKADLSGYKLASDTTVFSAGPIRVRILNATLDAHVSMEANIEGQTKKDARGSITANWVLDAGSELVAFENTQLALTNGRMDFRIEPQSVRMSGLLRMLSDVANALSIQKDGFYVGLMKQGEFPVGMKAVLELPSLSAGSTPVAINNLQLGAFFELRALDDHLRFNFTLGAGIHLSRKESPFSIAIFCLGGGGWVDASVRYAGITGTLEANVGLGLDACAQLDINLGVVKGYVRASLGIFCQYERHLDRSSQLLAGVRLALEGNVDVLGIVEVYLALLLEGIYDGHKLIGRGTVRLRIKICWCFTLSVSKSVTYSFGGGKATRTELSAIVVSPAFPERIAIAAREGASPPTLGDGVPFYTEQALAYLSTFE